MLQRISIQELEYIAELFSQQMKEEIGNDPGYQVRNIGKLDSSITQPFQEIANEELYPTLVSKASMLYYLCIKNHPFEDGNKRMGIFALLLFLSKNGQWLNADSQELFDITVYTAGSRVEDMQEVRKKIEEFVEENLETFDLD